MMALKYRLISGFSMAGAAFAGLLFLPPVFIPIVLVPLTALVMVEFYSLLDASKIPHFKVVGTICSLSLVLGTWLALTGRIPFGGEIEPMLLYVMFAACFLRQLFHVGSENAWETTAGTLLGIVYGGFLFNFTTKLLVTWGDAQGRFLIIFLIVVVKLTDIGAYFTGHAIGRHKLIPRVSPAKTWEGCFGGVIAGVIGGIILCRIFQHSASVHVFGYVQAAIIGFFLSIAGILGDLIESLFKRAAGVKDSGTIIRGMGGILDVFDSLLFAAPVLYIAARFVN
jgi:phosphatidate cytidylyltransferase